MFSLLSFLTQMALIFWILSFSLATSPHSSSFSNMEGLAAHTSVWRSWLSSHGQHFQATFSHPCPCVQLEHTPELKPMGHGRGHVMQITCRPAPSWETLHALCLPSFPADGKADLGERALKMAEPPPTQDPQWLPFQAVSYPCPCPTAI